MSKIYKTEIYSMSKEQNYFRGYKDGKIDVLDKIRAEIEQFADAHCSGDDIKIYDVFQIIDKYKSESEGA